MASQKPAKPDEEAVQRSQELWKGFTTLSTYSILFTIGVLFIMAVTLIDW